MSVAIVGGTGDQGSGLALRFAKAGRRVIIGSREVSRAESVAKDLTDKLAGLGEISGTENELAASHADVVILCVPLQAQIQSIREIRKRLLGKILVDVTVPLEACIGGRADRGVFLWEGSAAQRAAEMCGKEVKVVSAFQTVSAASLHDLTKDVESDVIVCSDIGEAKLAVMRLAEEIPCVRAIDGGGLHNSRIVEMITPLLIHFNKTYGVDDSGLRITGLPAK